MAAVFGICLLKSLPASAAEQKREPPKFSGYAFGDYYFASQHHSDAIEGMNGFWFRRVYFYYDQKLEKGFAVRFLLEANSPDGFDPVKNDTLRPFIKVLSLQYSEPLYSVQLGLIGTPTWKSVEDSLGYRSVEKTPMDLYKMGAAVDTGVSVGGFFSKDKRTSYSLMFGNGSSTQSEIDKGKTVYASLGHRMTPEIFVEVYGDIWNRSGASAEDWTTLRGLLVYSGRRGKIGLLYASQKRSKEGAPDLTLTVTSVYTDYRISERARPMFRVDFVSDPVPGGNTIAYLPLATNAKPTLYIFGIRYDITDFFYLVPNVEMVKYSVPTSGTQPDGITFYRLTFYFGWK
jgi:hypothetical protein